MYKLNKIKKGVKIKRNKKVKLLNYGIENKSHDFA